MRWLLLVLYALAAWAYSLLLMREAVLAQLLAIPFAAVLLALLLPQARALKSAVPRIAATLACVVLATPMVASALTKPLDPLLPSATMARGAAAPIVEGSCDYSPPCRAGAGAGVHHRWMRGRAFSALTDHSIVAASYHRNQRPMADVITGFTGSVEQAREIITGYQADYVMVCLSASDLALYRTAAPDNFANALAGDEVPAWLQPVPGFEAGALQALPHSLGRAEHHRHAVDAVALAGRAAGRHRSGAPDARRNRRNALRCADSRAGDRSNSPPRQHPSAARSWASRCRCQTCGRWRNSRLLQPAQWNMPAAVFVVERRSEGPLRPLFAQDAELLRGQPPAPFGLGVGHPEILLRLRLVPPAGGQHRDRQLPRPAGQEQSGG